ncbi:MAG: hypothetical protein ABFD89_15480 [Bryobacteraceae bacterium]
MPDLIEHTFDQAREIKWKAGRAIYGEHFVGDWLNEAFQENVDGANYADHGLTVEPKSLHSLIQRLLALNEEAGALCQEIHAARERLYEGSRG